MSGLYSWAGCDSKQTELPRLHFLEKDVLEVSRINEMSVMIQVQFVRVILKLIQNIALQRCNVFLQKLSTVFQYKYLPLL
jgi:hypothetical protein